MNKKTTALFILDGWGYSETSTSNAIAAANTPNWDALWANHPHTLIKTSGLAVGLPEGQMGNSEVGHMNLGAGRVVYQNFTRIGKAIEDGSFFENEALVNAVDKAVSAGKAVHILGLLSDGGVHSHHEQIMAMCELAAKRGAKAVYVHGFTDGRDTPPRSAKTPAAALDAKLAELGVGKIATLTGRYFAMDRDNRWDRVQTAYDAIVLGKGEFQAATTEQAIQAAYDRDENDEFVKATVIGDSVPVQDGDAIIFANFRPDRARQLTRAFTDADFDGFPRAVYPTLAAFVTFTEFASDIKAGVAFPPVALSNTFGEVLAKQGKKQLRIAETEKYAHVTFFFNGGEEALFDGEERELIPSPNVATYDLQPEMSAPEVTDKLVEVINAGKYDTIICNFANGDMVGHSGIFDAAVKAVEAVDACLGRIIEALQANGGQCLITADHGNVEQMLSDDGSQPLTSHTIGPVPLVLFTPTQGLGIKEGALCDLAPTLLDMMGMEKPAEMTGVSLLTRA
ncbi:2,3-bisphosphoglycerate-independent phosphoglycerate mutase [Marinomonas sp. M1K-6]|uniref:2,3-bisphosphoglycerate-independent phosphoglycerate mutase n=1 Tax=Marinomonas profundi TaxID=2726122 RepID=A0A847RB91_9GAMM|nr:2,3-bisphosphoglycerate-independent phosphoglycerate mutase [Marinomonas profundi]NLQ17490.1 2,3-bisphosphoglycerate-independent phosphoglycerate mutase [Marinomonas profundi]UDV02012.1 2,3-bisphosphoglycerate-independent phosphoglycerate mutase [Marinomonas profundi]